MQIFIKRVYDDQNSKDGLRILVDRLWPRGLSKEKAEIDVWLKSVSPSNELRKWYQHDAEKWPEFKQRYFAELDAAHEAVDELLGYVKKRNVTFMYAAKAPEHNNAVALKEYINSIL
ncbi:MAG: DUF488 domain-containing protein [Gammaproteobacteria bacterium]|jgi:uncharacterized protein YeaO (DUF488 family)|nr:DUF488 domain-containing protein [Gammaproteobacteria bacterium]